MVWYSNLRRSQCSINRYITLMIGVRRSNISSSMISLLLTIRWINYYTIYYHPPYWMHLSSAWWISKLIGVATDGGTTILILAGNQSYFHSASKRKYSIKSMISCWDRQHVWWANPETYQRRQGLYIKNVQFHVQKRFLKWAYSTKPPYHHNAAALELWLSTFGSEMCI